MTGRLIHYLPARTRRRLARWQALLELKLIRRPGRRHAARGVRVFVVLRNEMLRLPAFFRHYEKLGVGEYVIVDNNSTDGTAEYLASRDDVLLFSASSDFVGKERWVDYLLHMFGRSRWCLVVDVDELFDYPHSGAVDLGGLCRYLERQGANAVHAVLLDLYPDVPLPGLGYEQGEDYFARQWYFDPFESLEKAPRTFYRGSGLDFRFMGGMRKRLFGALPCCSKFPLFRFGPPMFLTDGQHYLEGGNFSPLRAVLYHFKYLQDFAGHVAEETQRNQYVWAAGEYRAYAQYVAENSTGLAFRNEASIRFRDMWQLVECGFATCPQDYVEYAGELAAAGPSAAALPS